MKLAIALRFLIWSAVSILVLVLANVGIGIYIYLDGLNLISDGIDQQQSNLVLFTLFLTVNICGVAVTCVGIYGADRLERVPIVAFMVIAFVCTLVDLAIAVAYRFRIDTTNSKDNILSIVLLAIQLAQIILLSIILGLFCVDPRGKTLFNKELAWCSVRAVVRFFLCSAFSIFLMCTFTLGINIYFYVGHYIPDKDEVPLQYFTYFSWSLLGTVCSSGLILFACFLGMIGSYYHEPHQMKSYLSIGSIGLVLQLVFVLFSLAGCQDAQSTIDKKNTTAFENALDYTQWQMAFGFTAATFLLTFASAVLLFFALITFKTDNESLYLADFL